LEEQAQAVRLRFPAQILLVAPVYAFYPETICVIVFMRLELLSIIVSVLIAEHGIALKICARLALIVVK
jgi:hypothetical protein